VLVAIAHTANDAEAEMVVVRLRGAGIDAFGRGGNLPGIGIAGGEEVYVEEEDADRARAVLAAPEISDEELAKLSDEAGREYGDNAS
jgi:hypothetical protein